MQHVTLTTKEKCIWSSDCSSHSIKCHGSYELGRNPGPLEGSYREFHTATHAAPAGGLKKYSNAILCTKQLQAFKY